MPPQPHPPSPPGNLRRLDSKIWRACAGTSVQIPIVYSRVYYFPQGHVEQSSPPPTFLSPKVLSILSFFAESLLLISSLIRLSMRFSLGSSSILFTLNRTSSTVHWSLLGAKTTLPLWLRTKSCPLWRFSLRPMPTTTADSPSRGSVPTQSDQRQRTHKQVTSSDANSGSVHWFSCHDLLVRLWASAPGGEPGWACELSGDR